MLESLLRRAGVKDVGIVLISSIAIIMIWRGTWNLLDQYFLTNNFVLSQTLSIVLGVLILIIMSSYGGIKNK